MGGKLRAARLPQVIRLTGPSSRRSAGRTEVAAGLPFGRMGAHRYWVMLAPSRSASETAAAARRAEELGLEGVFSIQLASNPFVPLAAAAVPTRSLRLGTGIALAFTRSPLETAFAALDLDHLSEGRFTLGLGSSVRWGHEVL